MLPASLLAKVRGGACSAALITALSTGAALAEDQAPKPAPEKVDSNPSDKALSADQLKLIPEKIKDLGSTSKRVRGWAAQTLYEFGKPVIPELEKALKDQKDERIKTALQDILKKLNDPKAAVDLVDQDPCPFCGKG